MAGNSTETLLNPASPGGDRMHETLLGDGSKAPRVVLMDDDGNLVGTSGLPLVVAVAALPVGTLANGAETAVSDTAVSILAANPSRKTAIVQNTGLGVIRVGVAGVTATTGLRLDPGDIATYETLTIVTQQLWAIRDGAFDSIAYAQEIT